MLYGSFGSLSPVAAVPEPPTKIPSELAHNAKPLHSGDGDMAPTRWTRARPAALFCWAAVRTRASPRRRSSSEWLVSEWWCVMYRVRVYVCNTDKILRARELWFFVTLSLGFWRGSSVRQWPRTGWPHMCSTCGNMVRFWTHSVMNACVFELSCCFRGYIRYLASVTLE